MWHYNIMVNCDCSQYHDLMIFTQMSKIQKCIFNLLLIIQN
jgi:hypothetical protein